MIWMLSCHKKSGISKCQYLCYGWKFIPKALSKGCQWKSS